MKRIAVKLIVFLLLGAVVNVGVAWGCALSTRNLRPSYEDREGRAFLTLDGHVRRVIVTRYTCGRSFLCGYPDPHWPPHQAVTASIEDVLPSWCIRTKQNRFLYYLFESFGWPCHSVSAVHEPTTAGPGWTVLTARGGISTSAQRYEVVVLVDHVLPYRPIFPGFLINTLFYAVLLWLLWSAPFATRRLIRKRRGRCLKCGYDLTGIPGAGHDVCPECGV